MRILFYGAGVIGSLYAALLSEAGEDVTVYARGRRLKSLEENGLQYFDAGSAKDRLREEGRIGEEDRTGEEGRTGTVRTAYIRVIAELAPEDRYDFIFLTVRRDQVEQALAELKDNCSPTIVTMVNSLDPYEKWEAICGKGRILPAFPGAGGGFEGDVLDAALTPRIIQPTTIGRPIRRSISRTTGRQPGKTGRGRSRRHVGGEKAGREKKLARLLERADIPCQIVPDMHAWQICHLAMVVPIADAYYEAANPEHAGYDRRLMLKTAKRIKENFRMISKLGTKLSPPKMNVFLTLPARTIAVALGVVFRSDFGDRFMYQHSTKAPEEMRQLHDEFYGFIGSEKGNS